MTTLIPIFCIVLIILIKTHILPMQVVIILSIASILGSMIIIGYYTVSAYYHPLAQRISKLLSEYAKEFSPCQRYQIILNLSGHPIETPSSYDGFNVRFEGCTIHGFISEKTFYLAVSHPENNLSNIANLWSEIGRCHIKFNDMCLAIHPDQLEHLDQMLTHEWMFIQHLLHSAPSVSLCINDESLSQSIYYVKEYGILPQPINIPSHKNLITTLQKANEQINYWVNQLFIQRNQLCTHLPINDQQRTHLFQLSQALEERKAQLLNIIAFCNETQVPLHNICIGMNELVFSKPNLLQRYRQPNIAILLSILGMGLYFTQSFIQSQINTTLSSSTGSQLAQQLYTLDHYPRYKSIQRKHLNILKSTYLENHPKKPVYEYLFSKHRNSRPQLKQHIINHLTNGQLNHQQVSLLTHYWFKPTVHTKPILSDIAPIILESHIPEVCYILEPQQTKNCIQSLGRIKNYQIYDQTLNNLEQTLIPLDINNYEQTLRQLTYLTQNPKHIGQGALRQLNEMMVKLSSEGHTTLVNKAKEIQSIIHLLQSTQGQHILHKIKSLHTLNHEINTDEEALQILQKAYMSDRHPLRELTYIQKNLAPYQTKWLNGMTTPIIHSISSRANQFLKNTWNEHVYPELLELKTKLPTNKESVSPYEMHYAFSLIHTYFDHYIRMFVQDENGDIIIKPYDLGIDIPEHILTLYIYTKVIASSLDIKEDHFHAAWAVSLKEMPHPIEAIYLHGANKKLPLRLHKGTVLHWDSRYPVGFDVELKDGETISIVQNNNWSILQLFSQLKEIYPLCYQYQSKDQSWNFSIEAKPQYPINLLNSDLIQSMPISDWQ